MHAEGEQEMAKQKEEKQRWRRVGVGARAVDSFVCEGGRLYYTFIDFSSIEHLLCAKKNELWALNLVLEITGALPIA